MSENGATGRPDLMRFQRGAVLGTEANLEAANSALLIAPTGAGKTAMMLTLAERHVARARAEGRPGKALILTHRQNLVDQILDRESRLWCSEGLGHIAPHRAGRGANQRPDIVVGMVQSASARPDKLADYDFVLVDECHHMYDGAAAGGDGEGAAGSQYEAVIAEMERRQQAKGQRFDLLGASATAFRASGEIHERLAAAPRHVVTYSEAIEGRRIVPPRTVEMDYRLTDGDRARDFMDEAILASRSGATPETIGTDLRKARGREGAALEGFAEQVVAGWKREAQGLKTLGFADSIEEVEAMARAFRNSGVSVETMHSGRSAGENAAASQAFNSDQGPDVMLSVGMVGEGYDAPKTKCTLIANGCPTRAWYAQMIGRSMRKHGDQGAVVLDYGAGSRHWGRMEQQIELQRDRVEMDRARHLMPQRSSLEAVAHRPEAGLPLMAFPSRHGTAYAIEVGAGKVQAYWQKREALRDTKSYRATQTVTPMAFDETPKGKPVPVEAFRGFVMKELDAHAGWHARARQPDGAGRTRGEALLAQDYKLGGDVLREQALQYQRVQGRSIGRVGDHETPQGRAATAVSAVRAVAAGDSAPAGDGLDALAARLASEPAAGRRETVYAAGLVAAEMADAVRGRGRQELRGMSARIVTDMGHKGLEARDARNPKLVGDIAKAAGRRMGQAAKALERDGHAPLAELARAWGGHCERAAGVAVKAPRQGVRETV